MTKIRYRKAPNYPGYFVGSDGSVWSNKRPGPSTGKIHKWKRLKLQPTRDGALYVEVRNNTGVKKRLVHSLVLEAFIGKRPEGYHACHFPDRDRSNNKVENLKWGLPSENIEHRDQYHKTTAKGERIGIAKLTAAKVVQIRRLAARGVSQKDIAVKFCVTYQNVRSIVSHRTWKHII